MTKLYKYLGANLPQIFITFLAASFFTFGIIPFLEITLNKYILLIMEFSKFYWIPYLCAVFIFLFSYSGTVKKYSSKYKSTFLLKDPSFLFLDKLCLFYFIVIAETYLVFSRFINASNFLNFSNVNFFIILIWFSINYFSSAVEKVGNQSIEEHKFFFPDSPIEIYDQDLLGRKKFVMDLYDELNKIPFDDSFVIGLSGLHPVQ